MQLAVSFIIFHQKLNFPFTARRQPAMPSKKKNSKKKNQKKQAQQAQQAQQAAQATPTKQEGKSSTPQKAAQPTPTKAATPQKAAPEVKKVETPKQAEPTPAPVVATMEQHGEEAGTAVYAPVVTGLQEIDVVTGEEDEDLVYSHLCLLYKYRAEPSPEWIGRGRGDIKLLKHKADGRCRLVLREDKTFKLRMNAQISHEVELQPQAGSEQAWMWVCTDYSEGNEGGVKETFAVKFKTPEIANNFKKAYQTCGQATASPAAPEGTVPLRLFCL